MSEPRFGRWIPAGILGIGCLLNLSVTSQRSMPLAAPLSAIPLELAGHQGKDIPIPPDQLAVAGTTTSLMRSYQRDPASMFSIYVGYYDRQRQGKTIHSPKNCLPGGGWEPLESRREVIPSPAGPIRVNRFVIAKDNARALVYYWYQGRGRTESNEYQVKLDLIRDSAIKRRSEEALVRIVVPLDSSAVSADSLSRRVIRDLQPHLARILPS